MSLLDKLDQPSAPGWMPVAEGDTISGIVAGLSERDAGYGPYPILTIEASTLVGGKMTSDEEVPKPPATLALHCLGVVLTNEVNAANLKPGDEVAARYNGKKQGRNGNSYDSWSFAYERSTALSKLDAASDNAHADLFKS